MEAREPTDPGTALGDRTAAFVLDWIVLGGLAFLAAGGGVPGLAALAVVTLVNQGVAAGLTGYSLGKAIAGVRVARADGTQPPGLVAGALRWLLLWVDVQLFGLVGMVIANRSPRRQRLGDRVAATWVVGLAPSSRARALASAGYLALCLALLFALSADAGLAVTAIFLPVGVAATLLTLGVARRWASWPWLTGLAVALVPAAYMASVKLCEGIAGDCISGDALSNSRQAIVSVIAFAVAAGLLALRRSRTRDIAFAALVLAGQLWLLARLLEADQVPAAVLVIALIVLELGAEVVARARRRRSAPAAA